VKRSWTGFPQEDFHISPYGSISEDSKGEETSILREGGFRWMVRINRKAPVRGYRVAPWDREQRMGPCRKITVDNSIVSQYYSGR